MLRGLARLGFRWRSIGLSLGVMLVGMQSYEGLMMAVPMCL